MYPYINIYTLNIPTYSLMLIAGFGLAYLAAAHSSKKEGLSTDHLLIIAAVCLGCAILGGKLLYLIVSFTLNELITIIRNGGFNQLMSGGLVFYGGLIGGIIGAFIGSKIAATPLLSFERHIIPYLPLGYGLGRIGCFLAGCCYGISYGGFCSVQYPGEDITRLPIQLIDAAISFIVCLVLLRLAKKTHKPFLLTLSYLIIYSIQRFIIEFFRGDAVRGIYNGLSTSQWISLALLSICVILIMIKKKEQS